MKNEFLINISTLMIVAEQRKKGRVKKQLINSFMETQQWGEIMYKREEKCKTKFSWDFKIQPFTPASL